MSSATIKLFLVHGDAKRLRTAALSNWTGKAVAAPRSEFESLLGREEAGKSGVYFLTGTDPDSGKPALYVGEAESVRERLRGHLEKDFWNHVLFFISTDENLTKAHVRYLEGPPHRAGQGGWKSRREELPGERLPESDREDMEVFLERIHQLMPVLGVDALVPIGSGGTGRAESQLLYCEIKGVKAFRLRSSVDVARWHVGTAEPAHSPVPPALSEYPRQVLNFWQDELGVNTAPSLALEGVSHVLDNDYYRGQDDRDFARSHTAAGR